MCPHLDVLAPRPEPLPLPEQRHIARTLTGGGFLSWTYGAVTDDKDLVRILLLVFYDAIPSEDDVVSKAAEHSIGW
ncbi:hypothetical protein PITC_022170 [Penicillium italicum]|uniref:Uncharacterized protein n=1 Tax=Penicillium italicum TaxID=40296 RepID=A0A0A2L2D7_PENIT|nr:hypothetical protein PITC_022170 [Penicillium italicum]